MSINLAKISTLIKMKLKFALSSSIATIVDYVLYQILVKYFFIPEYSNLLSASAGMIINFFLQKRFIFDLNRKATTAFAISALVSIGGIIISTIIIHLLTTHEIFNTNQYIIKAVATGIVFFYNFYLKRFAFEKKFL